MRESNETSDIDRGLFESVNFCLSLLFVEFMCLVFICLFQNQNNYDYFNMISLQRVRCRFRPT